MGGTYPPNLKKKTKRAGEIELQSGAKVLPVKIGTQRSRPKEAKFSHESLKMLGARLNLSDNEIILINSQYVSSINHFSF